jgi:peptidoglycan/LPS O-acetylase OafA/YrhL
VWWLVAAGVIAGPKILLLLPVWLFGVGAYRWAKPVFPVALAWLLAGGLLGLGALAVAYLPALPAAVGTKPLFMTGQFVTDWVVGALFALALWVLPGRRVAGASTWVKPLRRVADLSFPLYALHFPLLVLWRAVFDWQANSWPELGLVLVGVCLLAGTIGWLLEKQRGKWIRFFAWASTFIGKKPVASRIRLPD